MTRTLAKRREKNEELKREKEKLEREINEMKAKKSHLQGMQNVQIYSIALHPVLYTVGLEATFCNMNSSV